MKMKEAFPLLENGQSSLPDDADAAQLVFRVMTRDGPSVCTLREGLAVDLTAELPTLAHLLTRSAPSEAIKAAKGESLGPVDAIIVNSDEVARDPAKPYLLAPFDLQAVKACGVTFVSSMVERVVEEMTGGDPDKAGEARAALDRQIGGRLAEVAPGSAEAESLKTVLLDKGLWSQYLEVGLGRDAEIFTKGQPLSSVGHGATVGLHPRSGWNNPEPEVVLICASTGEIVGATLGNDVNLRDFEGRSALLLGRAKDNNASCAVGPFIRLFDDGFSLDDVRGMTLNLTVTGPGGFVLEDSSSMAAISRDPADLAAQLFDCHQYPDGAALFTGTLFSPTKDRDQPGQGFTHKTGDVVSISTPKLGTLANRVGLSSDLPPWKFGAVDLFRSLATRNIAF